MPMYGSFDDKFNAALANKLKNQDIHGAAETTNANAAMMNAQTTGSLAPSEIEYRKSFGDAAMMNAGTQRADLAQSSPMALTPQQVSAYGLLGSGFTGVPLDAQRGLRTPSPYGSQYARGGVIGDVNNDTGRDTQDVRARPGEYFINPETVTHGFGGGNYENGIRNLDEIVRRSTGREPGATYPKGKAGFARSGAAGPADGMSAAEWNRFVNQQRAPGGGAGVMGLPRLPARQFDRALTPALATPYSETDAAREAATARRPAPTTSAPVALTDPQWNAHVGGLRTGAGGYPILDGGAPYSNEGRQPPVIAAPNYSNEGRQAPALLQGSPYSNEGRQPPVSAPDAPYSNEGRQPLKVGAAPVAAAPVAAAPAAPASVPTLREGPNDWAIRDKIRGGAPAPSTQEGTRFIPQGVGGRPGEQVGIDYGQGFGMGPGAARIIATADKTGRFNSFSNLGMARGGRVMGKVKMPPPQKGLRMARGGRVPGFQVSGMVPAGQFPAVVPGQGPVDLTDPVARAQAAQDRWTAAKNAASQAQAVPDEAQAADAAARDAVAKAEFAKTEAGKAAARRAAYTRAGTSLGQGARTVVNVAKGVAPGLLYTAPLTGFGDYDINDPDVDSSAAGTIKYALQGEGGKVVDSLRKGAVEAGLDTISGLAKTVDFGSSLLGANQDLAGRFRRANEANLGTSLVPRPGTAVAAPAGPSGPMDHPTRGELELNPAAAAQGTAAAAPDKPSLRDMLVQQYMGLENNTNPYAGSKAILAKQHQILGYLGQVDPQMLSAQINARHQMMQYGMQHEKEMADFIDKAFVRPKLDKDGKPTGESVPDPETRNQFLGDASARGDNPYSWSPGAFQQYYKDWQYKHSVDQGMRTAMEAGAPGRYATSARGLPTALRDKTIGIDDWLDSRSSASLGDVGSAWINELKGSYGDPLKTHMLVQPYTDPITGQKTYQAAPAANALRSPTGNAVNIDAARLITGQGR